MKFKRSVALILNFSKANILVVDICKSRAMDSKIDTVRNCFKVLIGSIIFFWFSRISLIRIQTSSFEKCCIAIGHIFLPRGRTKL